MGTRWLIATDSIPIPKIDAIGFSDEITVNRHSRAIRNQYIIHYVLSGQGFFNGKTVEKGQGFLIFPDRYSEYFADEKDPWSFMWIISEDPSMEYFFDGYQADAQTGIFKFNNLYEAVALSKTLLDAKGKFPSSAQLATFFLYLFYTCSHKGAATRSSMVKTYFEFSVNYIKANAHLPITVRDLCATIGIAQPYLYRVFKEMVGCSPKQYISSFKLAEARRLLGHTDFSVSHIAEQLGFGSVMEFSKFFSKGMKMSPTRYRDTSDWFH